MDIFIWGGGNFDLQYLGFAVTSLLHVGQACTQLQRGTLYF